MLSKIIAVARSSALSIRLIATHPLTRNHKLLAFARVAHWQVKSRLHSELIVPWIGRTKLAVRRGMTGATGNIYTGLHEFNDMAFVLHFLRNDDIFADIGANVGSYTVLASGLCRARTISFEPDPTTFAALVRNIAVNNLEALVTPRNEALGPAPGKAELTIGLDTINRIVAGPGGSTQTVPMDTLDRALDGTVPCLMKLDVEGFEFEILRAADRTLRSPILRAVLTEDSSPPVAEMLHRAGFRERSYDPFSRRLRARDAREGGNTLFLRDEAFVQRRLSEAATIHVLGTRL
jgi:FkbM family methyltransferase